MSDDFFDGEASEILDAADNYIFEGEPGMLDGFLPLDEELLDVSDYMDFGDWFASDNDIFDRNNHKRVQVEEAEVPCKIAFDCDMADIDLSDNDDETENIETICDPIGMLEIDEDTEE